MRASLYEQLNYHEKDFSNSIETEMKCRVYFALFYLTTMNTRNSDLETLLGLTKKRMKNLKTFFGQHGAKFAQNKRLRAYLQVPYFKLGKSNDNETLEYCLSDQFIIDLEYEIEKEIDSVIKFLKKNSRNKSFIVKIFEYYTNTNVKADEMRT